MATQAKTGKSQPGIAILGGSVAIVVMAGVLFQVCDVSFQPVVLGIGVVGAISTLVGAWMAA